MVVSLTGENGTDVVVLAGEQFLGGVVLVLAEEGVVAHMDHVALVISRFAMILDHKFD